MIADTQFTWFGHASWGITTSGGVRILVDPWLETSPVCPDALKQPEADVILVTHGHFDHTADVPAVAARTGAVVVAQFELAGILAAQGAPETVGMNTGGTVEARGITATMTHAFHSSTVGEGEALRPAGDPVGFVVGLGDGRRVYIAGDTGIFGDMQLIGDLYRPDLAILPIGDLYTMGPFQAAHAVRLLGVDEVLCSHWGTFPALTGTPAALRDELAALGLEGVTVHDLPVGATLG